MPVLNSNKSDAEKATDIIRDAGGEVVGKTRLQKMAYLLEISGLGCGFSFEYRHYGPYSEDLADGLESAQFSNLLIEEEHTAKWGGSYSIFKTISKAPETEISSARRTILELGMKANPISLELAATAAFLAKEEEDSPWAETERRKPEKAKKWLQQAKALYAELKKVKTPKQLPAI